MNVEIQGFTPVQQALADSIWQLESPEQLNKFFEALPAELIADAYLAYRMIVETVMDDVMLEQDCSEAAQLIAQVSRGASC